LLVLVFIGLVLSFFSLSYRHLVAALRVETAGTLIAERDEGSTAALGAGIALLETGVPPSDVYSCGITVETTQGPRSYVVSYVHVSDGEEGKQTWSVESRPMGDFEEPPAMPGAFEPPEEPEEPPATPPDGGSPPASPTE
jgi:hypothetical protein